VVGDGRRPVQLGEERRALLRGEGGMRGREGHGSGSGGCGGAVAGRTRPG
jgi:hypothetical protein